MLAPYKNCTTKVWQPRWFHTNDVGIATMKIIELANVQSCQFDLSVKNIWTITLAVLPALA
jgi:hypothetical protein